MIRELRDMGSPSSSSTAVEEGSNIQQQRTSEVSEASRATTKTEGAASSESSKTAEPGATQPRSSNNISAPTQPSVDLITSARVTQPAVAKETIKQLEDINAALSKFGTSMEEVLKLDSQTASGGAGTPMNGTEVGQDGTVSVLSI